MAEHAEAPRRSFGNQRDEGGAERSLSVLDGWWLEGCFDGVTGWAIGHAEIAETEQQESASLYEKLEQTILPMFYGRPTAYAEVMRSAIAVNGSFFNAQRMLSQYLANAYFQRAE